MVKLDKPIRVTTTGNQFVNVVNVGYNPLPINDNNVKCALYGGHIYASAACTVRITASTVLLEITFANTGNHHFALDLPREGVPTHGIRYTVSQAASGTTTTAILDIGYEYTGGNKAS